MTKQEAIKAMVKEFQMIPQDWVQTVLEKDDQFEPLPAWGTLFFIEDSLGEELWDEKSRVMLGDKSELWDEARNLDDEDPDKEKLRLALEADDWDVLSDYIDEDMSGGRCIIDDEGHPTNMFIYNIRVAYLIGIHAYGFDFYDGVWNRLYDILGLEWHSEDEK